MKRAIGIVLILFGIGILVASGYLFPNTVHHLNIGQDLFPPVQPGRNWVPLFSGLITLIGFGVLLSSTDDSEDVHHNNSHA